MDLDPATLEVRPAREEDVPRLVALEDRWLAEDSTIGMVAVTAEEVRGWLGPYCWVAEHDGEIVGFAYGRAEVSEGLAVIPAGEPYLRVEELYVLPEHRDRGVGGRLLDQLLAEAAARGIARGRVYSSSRDWRRIVDFYQRHGFAMWCVELYR
jgi:GNAT superfamily N-acetyltransferase